MTIEERFNRIESILEKVADNQAKQDVTLTTLIDSHIQTQEELQALAAEVRKTQEGLQTLERQWQAYLTTIRPQ